MATYRLAAIFTSAATSTAPDTAVEVLERELLVRLEAARAAWPEISMVEEAFVGHLARHAEEGLPPAEHSAEVWLACACANGSPRAIAALQQRYRRGIERAAARIDPGVADEATQVVLASLVVRDGDEPARIAAYGGRCALSTWLATISARAAIKLRRGLAHRPHESVSQVACAAADDQPELVLLRTKYAPELDAALRVAIAGLEVRPRLLLRLHYAERWSLERLAAFYEISRATAARRVADARQALYDATKRHLAERFEVTSAEFASIAALLGGEVEVSVVRLLQEDEPEVPGGTPAASLPRALGGT